MNNKSISRPCRTFVVLLCFAIAVLGGTGRAHSADIYNNWNAQSYQLQVSTSNQVAQSFVTGNSPIVLDSVSVMLNNQFPISTSYSMRLYSSSVGNTPQTELQNIGSKTLPSFFDSTSGTTLPQNDISFTSIGFSLAANTQYFIVLSANSILFNWKGPSTDPTSLATPPVTYYTLESSNGSDWNVSGTATKPLAMVVTGTPVPEPSTILLTTIAVVGLLGAKRSRSRKG